MPCKKCGSACQGRLCTFCAREKSREGDWQDAFSDYDDTEDETDD